MRKTSRTLEQMHRRATAYEIALDTPTGRTILGYSERRTRAVLISASQDAADSILPYVANGAEWKYRDGAITWAPGVVVRFTGRTERDAASAATMTLHIGSRERVRVNSLDHASEVYSERRDASGEGASTFPRGKIVQAGMVIATVSYNGRLWSLDGKPLA